MTRRSPWEPSVSVVIPAFDAEAWLGRSVRSVLADPEVFEVLVVEDGSEDRTRHVAERLAAQDPRVRVLAHPDESNHGAAASRNLGIDRSRAPYVSFLDADDVALPSRYTDPVEILAGNPEADGVYESVAVIAGGAKRPRKPSETPMLTIGDPVAPEDLLKALLAPDPRTIHTDGLLIRRSVFARIGGFPEDFVIGEDMHLLWRLAASCTMLPGRLDRPVAEYHRRPDGLLGRSDALLVEHRFLRSLDVYRWARGRRDVSPVHRGLLRRVLVHDIAAWRGEPIGRAALRSIQARRWFRAMCVAPELLLAKRIWLGVIGLQPDPEVTTPPEDDAGR